MEGYESLFQGSGSRCLPFCPRKRKGSYLLSIFTFAIISTSVSHAVLPVVWTSMHGIVPRTPRSSSCEVNLVPYLLRGTLLMTGKQQKCCS